jgi:hypothetical protein
MEKIIKLKNIYSGEIVFTSDRFEKRITDGKTFIQVFKDTEKERKYWVFEGAFKPQTN